MTSFSRELSKRPFEVLRKNLPDIGPGNLQPITENKSLKPSLINPVVVQIPKHSVRTSKSLEILLQRQANAGESTSIQNQNLDEKQISPRRVNLQLSDAYLKSIESSQKRPNSRILVPSFISQYPFSEETTPQPPATEQKHIGSMHKLPSTSPDFMLVGAQFTGDNLVLTDRAGKIVHQLTEGDSEPNIEATSTDELRVCVQDEELPPSGVQPPPPTAVEYMRTQSELGQSTCVLSAITDTPPLTDECSEANTQTLC